jgi:hypothetical protein
MKFFTLLLLASCTTILPTYAQDAGASTSAQAKAVTPLQQELINTQRAFMDAVEHHDLDYVKNAIADDFVGIGTTGDADHKSDVLAGLRVDPSRKEKDKKEEKPILYFFNVVPLNDGAAVVTFDIANPAANPRYLHVSDTWVKQGDQWKLKFHQSTPNRWSATDLD